eukprot:TRINITY_DN63653_c0_g1_i1.p1 TRINITY_DN63653_c0_g1~~TRINITY_DN63653_c0_g1_i1.p1  ORF type:complete len:612 (-),score=134.21 TRINITY_DN63653_c0_g1_i1:46-1791(-)
MRILLLATVSASVAAKSQSAAPLPAVARVQDTLQSLLTSLQSTGRSAKSLLERTGTTCSAASRAFHEESDVASARLAHLQADLREREASLKESTGIVSQHQAEMALAQHTINVSLAALNADGGRRTRAEKQALNQLIESRQQMLVDLQGELDGNLLPSRSRLQVDVAETKRRMQDHSTSVAAIKLFARAIRDGCSGAAKRGESMALARSDQARHIGKALQLLEPLVGVERAEHHSPESSDDLQAPSFVQVSSHADALRETEDALGSLFGHADADAVQVKRDSAPAPSRILPTKPKEQPAASLIERLKAVEESKVESERKAWCAKERAHNEQLLALARDAMDRATAQVELHAEAESRIQQRLDSVNASVGSIVSATAEAADNSRHEAALLEASAKDQLLAAQILTQASSILESLETTGSGPDIRSARENLIEASKSFKAVAATVDEARASARQEAEAVAAKANEATHALRRERETLETDRDAHRAERLSSEDSRREQEAESKDASEFLQRLSSTCGAGAFAGEEGRRGAEVRALSDSQSVLEGKHIAHERRLRGGPPAVNISKLSPIERAAMEMGIPVAEQH